MRIAIIGGTGYIGSLLWPKLAADGHEVTVISRNPEAAARRVGPTVRAVAWDIFASPDSRVIDGLDVVINLAGESLDAGLWTERRKDEIVRSRLNPTRAIAGLIKSAKNPPTVLLNASAVGYYGSRGDEPLDENSAPGTGFLANLCTFWERAAQEASSATRIILLRTAPVLGRRGGLLARLKIPFKLFLGNVPGDGRQWFPWIHQDDLTEAIGYLLVSGRSSGPVNLAAPNPVTMAEFCRAIGRAMNRPVWLKLPKRLLRFGLGETADLLLTSQRVIPMALQQSGFQFRFPDISTALNNLL